MVLNDTTLKTRRNTGRVLFAVVLVGCLLLALSGCASWFPVTGEVPVSVSCVKKDPRKSKPEMRTEAEILALDDYQAILAYRSELKKRETYIGDLEDVVDVCDRAPQVVTVPR